MSSPEMGKGRAVNSALQSTPTNRLTENHSHTDGCQYATTATGEVCLSAIGADSPTPRYEVYLFGYLNGREALAGELERLRWERDLWFYCYSNRKTPADFYRHLTSELWREAVAA